MNTVSSSTQSAPFYTRLEKGILVVASILTASGVALIVIASLGEKQLLLPGAITCAIGTFGLILSTTMMCGLRKTTQKPHEETEEKVEIESPLVESTPPVVNVPKENLSHLSILERLERAGLVGLPEEVTAAFQAIVTFRGKNGTSIAAIKKQLQSRGVEPPKGVLIVGPPGTGKTQIAKCISEKILECDEKQIIIRSAADVKSMWQGETEKNIKSMFNLPEGSEFSVIILDEIDALAANRMADPNQTTATTQLLVEMEGLQSKNHAFVIGITNHEELLDDALISRFASVLRISLPDDTAREKIFKRYLQPTIDSQSVSGHLDYSSLVKESRGFAGREIKDVVNQANTQAIQRFHQVLQSYKNDKGSEPPEDALKQLEEKGKLTQDDLMEWIKKIRQKTI